MELKALLGGRFEALLVTITIEVLAVAGARPFGTEREAFSAAGDFFLVLFPQILLVLYPHACYFALPLVLLVALLRGKRKDASLSKRQLPSGHLPHLTNLRSTVMSITMLCILAVDFVHFFPARFRKTHTFGASLMDVGVGTIIYTGDISAGLAFARHRRYPRLRDSLTMFLMLVTIGCIRTGSMEATGRPPAVAEYGTHWNFFFTLAVMVAVDWAVRPMRLRWFIGVLLMIAYEAVLEFAGLYAFVNADIPRAARSGLIEKNKEGICSAIGYSAIYLIASWAGSTLLDKNKHRGSKIMATAANLAMLLYPGAQASRRSANLSYATWMLAFCGAHHLTIMLLFELPAFVANPLSGIPTWYESISRLQMEHFIVANLLTAVANITIKPQKIDNAPVAVVYLAVYMAAIGIFGRLFQAFRSGHRRSKEKAPPAGLEVTSSVAAHV